MNKIIRLNKIKKCTVIALAASFAVSAGAAVAGFNGNIASAKTKEESTTLTVAEDIWNTETQSFNAGAVKEFVKQLTGKAAGTSAELEQSLAAAEGNVLTAADVKANNGGKDVIVQVGGKDYPFTPTYVSKLDTGEIIVTLWLTYNGGYIPYSGAWDAEDSSSYDYPANMYSSSYARSFISGSPYAIADGATIDYTKAPVTVTESSQVHLNYSGGQHNMWKTFLGDGKTLFMIQPKFVSWQKSGVNKTGLGSGYDDWPDDGINHSLSTEGESHPEGFDYTDKGGKGVYYDSWGNDYVWLPSLYETGYRVNGDTGENRAHMGLWEASTFQLENILSPNEYQWNGYWMRGGFHNDADRAYIIRTDGMGANVSVSEYNCYRPAFHLNLTKALASIEQDENSNKDLQDEWNKAVEKSMATGTCQTFTLTRNWYATPTEDGSSFGKGIGFFSQKTALNVPKGAKIKLDLNGFTIDRNLSKPTGNGAVIYNYGDLEICDSSASKTGKISGGNSSSYDGGGVFTAGGKLILNGGTICNNKATGGGGLAQYWAASRMEINDGAVICNNNAVAGGGAMWINEGILEINGGIISDNSTLQKGGGIYMTSASLKMNAGVITKNSCTHPSSAGDGAGIYSNATHLEINGGKIEGNYISGSGHGGAVIVINGTFDFYGGELTDNYTKLYGGAMYLQGSTFNFYGGKISNNYAKEYSGCVHAMGSSVVNMYGGEVSGNKTTGNGTLYFDNSTFNFYDGVIKNNKASRGAGFYLNTSSTAVMNGGLIDSNLAYTNGGGVLLSSRGNASFTMNGGYITNNRVGTAFDTANFKGGGVKINETDTFVMKGGIISGNYAPNGGGGVYLCQEGTFIFRGGLVINNTAESGVSNAVVATTAANPNTRITVSQHLTDGAKMGVSLVLEMSKANEFITGAVTSGYVASGNTAADFGKYFFADLTSQKAGVAGNEITLSAGAEAARTSLQWTISENGATPENISSGELYRTLEYSPDKTYTVSNGAGIYSIYNDKGRPASNPVFAVGKYTFTCQDAQKYDNPVYILEIKPLDISAAAVEFRETALVYSGKALTPAVKVTFNGTELAVGNDYTLEYSDNVKAGTAKLTLTGKGNFTGEKSAAFTIAKRNLDVRWGEAFSTYDGTVKSIAAYAEGALAGDNVTLSVVYEDRNGGELNGRLVNPVNAGVYRAYAILNATNYAFAATATVYKDLKINPVIVDAVWSRNSFVYDGTEHAPTAQYADKNGNTVSLTVTVDGAHSTAGEYQAKASIADKNYALSAATEILTYKITPATLTVTGKNLSKVYNGGALGAEFAVSAAVTQGAVPAAGDLTLSYFAADGTPVTGEPVNAGVYKVKLTLDDGNFALSSDEFAFTVEKTDMTLAGADGGTVKLIYTGEAAQTALTATGTGGELEITVKYSADNGVTFTDEAPVNAGNYKIKVTANDGNYNDITLNLAIAKKTVAVSWRHDGISVADGATFVWAYDGKEHAPLCTAEGVEVKLSGAAKTGTFTVTAAFADSSLAANYALANATASCRVENSVISEILWYEYGADTPLDGVPEIEEISVYGAAGPKLTAFGKVQLAGAENYSLIALGVEYTAANGSVVSFAGQWAQGDYVAVASLVGHGVLCELPGGVSAETQFKVIAQKFDSVDISGIVWAVNTESGYVAAEGYTFVYSGRPLSPEALMPVKAEIPVDLSDPATYSVLPTGGAQTDAGTYTAFIKAGDYNVAAEYATFEFTIVPKQIKVVWSGDGLMQEGFKWIYDGNGHAPAASADNVTGVTGEIVITVEKEVRAGAYTAVARVSKNFEIIDGATREYVIEKRVVNAGAVVWSADEKAEERDGYFVWAYDGEKHAPQAALTVDGVALPLKVTGAVSEAGAYYAYAVLDGDDFITADYTLAGAKQRFDIVRDTIAEVLWRNDRFVYDGAEHKPEAYYINADGAEVALEVFGARTDAGVYVAYAVTEAHVLAGATHGFTVEPKTIAVSWAENKTFIYNGKPQKPAATAVDGAEGRAEIVLKEGVDYTVTAFVNAGAHVAEFTFINGNYACADDTRTCDYIIDKKEVTVYWVNNTDGTAVWQYDGKPHAPSVDSVGGAVAGEKVEVTVIGAETQVGSYTAYAVTDNNNYALVNANGGAAQSAYGIAPFAITLSWSGNAENGGKFEWTYDGVHAFAPSATYTDWETDGDGKPVVHSLTVENGGIMGAQTDAGVYFATALLPQNCRFAGGNTKEFKINKCTVEKIDWSADGNAVEIKDGETVVGYKWVYDGEMHGPAATVHGTGAALVVTGEARGTGKYVATAKLGNPENYGFADDAEGLEMPFEIAAKEVDIEWFGSDGVNEAAGGSFAFTYTGAPVSPVAKFKGADGEYVVAPVSGAAVNASDSEYNAYAVDVFADYSFNAATVMKKFTVGKQGVEVSWTAETEPVAGVYTYTFNGTAQQPFAAANSDGVGFSYTIIDARGEKAEAIINVGTYTVTATPVNSNYAASGTMSVTVKIEPKTVAVVWGEVTLEYNGAAQTPKAWYIDANGLAVELVVTVEGEHAEAGTYSATASLASGEQNYVLQNAEAKQFEIKKSTVDRVEWDFDLGKWKLPE